MFKNEVIDRYIYTLYFAEFKKNAQVSIYTYSLAVNIGHCAKFLFLVDKLGRFLMFTFLK